MFFTPMKLFLQEEAEGNSAGDVAGVADPGIQWSSEHSLRQEMSGIKPDLHFDIKVEYVGRALRPTATVSFSRCALLASFPFVSFCKTPTAVGGVE